MSRTADPLEVVGLVPMAGRATRLGRLPCSKEILPLGPPGPTGQAAPVVSARLFESFRRGGVRRAFVVLGQGKWDIPSYLGRGEQLGLDLAYVVAGDSPSVPFSLVTAAPFLAGARVALGFPDLLFEPITVYGALSALQGSSGADVVLGVVPHAHSAKADMVEVDRRGRVRRIVIKAARSGLRHTWMCAVWTPRFTRFLSTAAAGSGLAADAGREPHVGDVVLRAIDAGLEVRARVFPRGRCLDVGTPGDLGRAMRARLR
jgi:glucose-1-phosphate thymidylyltransferase